MAQVSINEDCIDSVATDIGTLATAGTISGLHTSRIYRKKLPTDRDVTPPCVVVSYPPNDGELMVGSTNETEDIGYPVMVTFLVSENQDMEINADSDQVALWRQKILLRYHNKRLTGVSEVDTCKVRPLSVIDLDAFLNRNLFAGALLIHCIARMPRT